MLEVKNIKKDYENHILLNGITFSVKGNQITSLLGPSGSGKSTLLRIIAGLEEPNSGEVFWDGKNISKIPTYLRNFGLMFQEYALFPHLNVEQNIAFGLRMQNVHPSEIEKRVTKALSLVQMESFAKREIPDLSGGEQQRVALARTIAPEPRLLMLDEPLSALDESLKEELLLELNNIFDEIDMPVIYVTHDQTEAFSIADRALILHEGVIQQDNEPKQVFENPSNQWVAGFLGYKNLLKGTVCGLSPLMVATHFGDYLVECDKKFVLGEKVNLILKPDGLMENSQNFEKNFIFGEVENCIFREGKYLVTLANKIQGSMTFLIKNPVKKGKRIERRISPTKILCYKTE